MQTQINPPFDETPACAGCSVDVRAISATIHNFLTRCDVPSRKIKEKKAMSKLYDLKHMTIPQTTISHKSVTDLLAIAQSLQEATGDMVEEQQTIRWSPETIAKVEALIERAAEAVDAYDAVSTAHFADNRHAFGDHNVLRAHAGMRWAGFVNPEPQRHAYNYTVTKVDQGGDLTHKVCQDQFALHDHFKDTLKADPTFYGKVFCPSCQCTAPWGQFYYHPQTAS
jgi:hypothetical protein